MLQNRRVTSDGGPAADDAALELTILMPCLNEAETIETVVRRAQGFLANTGIAGEVLIADNGSTDGSVALAQALGARVVPISARGYGSALRGGIAAARGRYVIMGDADDSYDFSDLSLFMAKLESGADLVMGNRYAGGIAEGAMPLLHRYLGNPVLSAVGRILFRVPINDFHCGLRGFRRDAIVGLNLRTAGMEFASEMVVHAALRGLDIVEVPTTLEKDGRSRPPHLDTWRDGWRHLRFLMLHSPRWAFIYPGMTLLALGACLAGVLMPGRLAIANGVSLDARAFLVACVMALVGLQALTFGVIARRYSVYNDLLPHHRHMQRFLDAVTLERLLIAGGVLAALGTGGLGLSIAIWGRHSFGDLSDGQLVRGMILSTGAVTAAAQLCFSAMLMGVLDLARGGDARQQQARLLHVFPGA